MRILLLLTALLPAAKAAHFSRMDQIGTDQRIAAAQKALAASPGDPVALNSLAAAYLQKMRETTDFSYVDRADKLVAQALAKRPDDLEALIVLNEIDIHRHHFDA